MSTTTDVGEIEIDRCHPTRGCIIIIALTPCRVRVSMGMDVTRRNSGPVLVEMATVLEEGLGLGGKAEVSGDGGHKVDLVIDNHGQAQGVQFYQVWELVFVGSVRCHGGSVRAVSKEGEEKCKVNAGVNAVVNEE